MPSSQLTAVQTPERHVPLVQSACRSQLAPVTQAPHASPPQSMSVSSPLRVPSSQLEVGVPASAFTDGPPMIIPVLPVPPSDRAGSSLMSRRALQPAASEPSSRQGRMRVSAERDDSKDLMAASFYVRLVPTPAERSRHRSAPLAKLSARSIKGLFG